MGTSGRDGVGGAQESEEVAPQLALKNDQDYPGEGGGQRRNHGATRAQRVAEGEAGGPAWGGGRAPH